MTFRQHPLKRKWINVPLDDLVNYRIVFYDTETDDKFATYANLQTCAVQYGLLGEPEMVSSAKDWNKLESWLADPEVIKVDFNGVNYDNVVLAKHHIVVAEENWHDMFQAFKNISPNLPSYSQKFIAYYYLADLHFPEMRLHKWFLENDKSWEQLPEAPPELVEEYNKWDITQLVNLFRIAWDNVRKPEYWESYLDDMLCGKPLAEICLKGGDYLDGKRIMRRAMRMRERIERLTIQAERITDGEVANVRSVKQLGQYLRDFENIELKLTDSGEFALDKRALQAIIPNNKVAWIASKVREATKSLAYYENMTTALEDRTYMRTVKRGWIPKQISISSARTRRATSQSKHKINFQNIPPEVESVQIIPVGKLYWKIDLDQVENVVHIFYSKDRRRRRAYESDPKWSEYVWLANEILGTSLTKDELEKIPSKMVPNWSEYKLFKSCKLGMNFGMGVGLFCEMNGLARDIGRDAFNEVHRACPAIKELQNICAGQLNTVGYVVDPFGKRYTGPARMAYKVVAYWVQGCGTGSLPKAILRDNWDSQRSFGRKSGDLNGTTHDDFTGYISLEHMTPSQILQLLQMFKHNVTKYSSFFGDIPLRSKLKLSRTTVAEAQSFDFDDRKSILKFIRA